MLYFLMTHIKIGISAILFMIRINDEQKNVLNACTFPYFTGSSAI